MASPTDLCNQALSLIGVNEQIGTINDDKNLDAKKCRLWFAAVNEELHRMHPWSFALKNIALQPSKNDHFNHYLTPLQRDFGIYAQPSNNTNLAFVPPQYWPQPNRIYVAQRFQLPNDLMYAVSFDGHTRYGIEGEELVLHDRAAFAAHHEHRLRYVHLVQEPPKWDALYTAAFVYKLAEKLSYAITNSSNMQTIMQNNFEKAFLRATKRNAAEKMGQKLSVRRYQRARGW